MQWSNSPFWLQTCRKGESTVREGYAVQEVLFLLGWKGQARVRENLACHANTSLLGFRQQLVLALGMYLNHHSKEIGCSSWPFNFTSIAVLRVFTNMHQPAHGYHPFYRLTLVISVRPLHKKHMAFLLKVAPLKTHSINGSLLELIVGLFPSHPSPSLLTPRSVHQFSLVCPTALYLFFIPIHRYYQILWHPYL